jgi:hypothetical protein
MTFLSNVNVGGINNAVMPKVPMGTCPTPAGTEVKLCTFSDDFELTTGCFIAVKFTYANTYGDGSSTYPKISIGGEQYPLKLMTNAYASTGAWANNQTLLLMFDGTNLIKVV